MLTHCTEKRAEIHVYLGQKKARMRQMDHVICIVGLGYVGLPLAHAFAKKGYETYGYDIDPERINELKDEKDRTRELTADQLQSVDIKL